MFHAKILTNGFSENKGFLQIFEKNFGPLGRGEGKGKNLLFVNKKKQKKFINWSGPMHGVGLVGLEPPSGSPRPRGESRQKMDEVFLLLFVHKKKILAFDF